VNDEPDDITREIFIAATPDTVFGFLIDPALIMKWNRNIPSARAATGRDFSRRGQRGQHCTRYLYPSHPTTSGRVYLGVGDTRCRFNGPRRPSARRLIGGDRSHTEGRRNSIAIPSQLPTESIVEIARRTVVYLSQPPQNRGFGPCSRRTTRCNQHVARDLISRTQDQEEKSAHENPQTNGHIQGRPSTHQVRRPGGGSVVVHASVRWLSSS